MLTIDIKAHGPCQPQNVGSQSKTTPTSLRYYQNFTLCRLKLTLMGTVEVIFFTTTRSKERERERERGTISNLNRQRGDIINETVREIDIIQ